MPAMACALLRGCKSSNIPANVGFMNFLISTGNENLYLLCPLNPRSQAGRETPTLFSLYLDPPDADAAALLAQK